MWHCVTPQNDSLHPTPALGEGHRMPLHPALIVPYRATSPLPHQLLTSQHRTCPGHHPRQLLPKRSPFQSREAASPVSRQPFQGKDPRSSDTCPRASSSCGPTVPWSLHEPWAQHRQIYFGGPNPAQTPSPASGRRMHSGTGCIINQQQI